MCALFIAIPLVEHFLQAFKKAFLFPYSVLTKFWFILVGFVAFCSSESEKTMCSQKFSKSSKQDQLSKFVDQTFLSFGFVPPISNFKCEKDESVQNKSIIDVFFDKIGVEKLPIELNVELSPKKFCMKFENLSDSLQKCKFLSNFCLDSELLDIVNSKTQCTSI